MHRILNRLDLQNWNKNQVISIIKNCLIMVYKSNRNTINHQKIYPIIHPSIEIRISKEIKSICTVFVSNLINHDHQSILIKVPLFQKRNSPAQCFYYRNHFSIYFGFLRKNSELRRNSQVCKEGPQVVSRFGICLTRLLVEKDENQRDKTRCQLCKRLAGPIFPLSWFTMVWKRVSPMDVVARWQLTAILQCVASFSAW